MTCACAIDRDLDNEDDLLFGVHEEMLYARNSAPVPGAQWTGIVTQIAIDMLESGAVDAVVCVQSQDGDRFAPKPVHELALQFAKTSWLRRCAVDCSAANCPEATIRYMRYCGQVVARCKDDILAAKGVKPTLSPNLNVLATVEALDVKRLLFIGVGCQASWLVPGLGPACKCRGPG